MYQVETSQGSKGDRLVLVASLQAISGFGGFVPADLECLLSVAATNSTGAAKDEARTQKLPTIDYTRDSAVFGETLMLNDFTSTDIVDIYVRCAGDTGVAFAVGSLPVSSFQPCVSATQDVSDAGGRNSAYSLQTAVYSTLRVRLQTSDSYAQFCTDANGKEMLFFFFCLFLFPNNTRSFFSLPEYVQVGIWCRSLPPSNWSWW